MKGVQKGMHGLNVNRGLIFFFFIENVCLSIFLRLLPQNQLFYQQAVITVMYSNQKLMSVPSFIRIETGSEEDTRPKTYVTYLLIKSLCISMFLCLRSRI